jgi:hypothetical protein
VLICILLNSLTRLQSAAEAGKVEEEKLVEVLRDVMADSVTVDLEHGSEPLKDQPIRDIMRSIFNTKRELVSPVLGGLAMYMRTVHPGPYSAQLVEGKV